MSLKDYLYISLIIIIVAGGVWYHHKLITEGVAQQKASDEKATATLLASTAKQTQALQVRATTAEQAYEKEVAANAGQPVIPVRLCSNATPRGQLVPKAGAANPGDASARASATAIPNVPHGNSGSGSGNAGPDIGALLETLAKRCDDVSAELREYQSR
jgi:hypothetical protein